jgi:hypothetical protein
VVLLKLPSNAKLNNLPIKKLPSKIEKVKYTFFLNLGLYIDISDIVPKIAKKQYKALVSFK